MTRSNLAAVVLALVWVGCGPQEASVEEAGLEAQEQTADALVVSSPGDGLEVWQQNIEAMKGADAPALRLTRAMRAAPYAPDIVVLAEAWQKVLCGDYLNPEAPGDIALNNWRESPHADGLASGCRLGLPPRPGSVLHRLGLSLWGAPGNAAHRRPYDDDEGSTSRTGTPVIWDARRFTYVDGFVWSDADVPGCGHPLEGYRRTAVLLKDSRRTAAPSDDQRVAVASVHYGSGCIGAANRWVAEEMVRRWGARGLDVRLIGGDFNAGADGTSSRYVDRRREAAPDGWYRAITNGTGWRGGSFVDAARVAHHGNAICAEWTYPNAWPCVDVTACSGTCPGYGIGGALERIDYLFVSGAEVVTSGTEDGSSGYSDHKATVTRLRYR